MITPVPQTPLGTIAELCELSLQRHRLELSDTSLNSRRSLTRTVIAEFGADRDLGTIGRREAQEFLNRLRQRLKPASIRSILSFLRKLHALACEERDLMVDDPFKGVRSPRPNNARNRVLSEEEEARLRAIMDRKDFAVLQLAIYTGLRRLELFYLKPEDIQFFQRPVENPPLGRPAFELVGTAHVTTSKTGKGRVTPLNRVAAAICRYFVEQKTPWLLGGHERQTRKLRYGAACEFVSTKFKPACKKAGIEGLRWHDLRHTCASRALRNGARLEEVQQLLGHSSIVMTERYSHWEDRAIWSAANALVGGR
jgi:site-specific recombinase XerD